MTHQKESPTAQAVGPNTNIMTPIVTQDDGTDRKLFASLAARAALKGHQLTKTVSGYQLSRWSHSRHVGDLDTVQALLQRMGV